MGRQAKQARTGVATQQDKGSGTTAPAGRPATTAPRKRRVVTAEARRADILAAALDEFTARGYAAARLDDVARRAGVAKGTIYLHFADKETLFQELVRSMVHPLLGTLERLRALDIPACALVEAMLATFVREVLGTRRKDIVRLVLTEGARFPTIAEFYHREVVARVLAIVRPLLKRAFERGELATDALARFPQLIIAPALVAILWSGLFERFEPLDVPEMIRAHLGILFGGRGA